LKKADIPIFARVVKKGVIICECTNTREKDNDITGHAEINVLREAARKLGSWKLSGCEIYTTLEPCLMCTAAIIESRISKLYFAAFDEKEGACGSLWNIPLEGKLKNSLEVYGGVEIDGKSADQWSDEIKEFFKIARNRIVKDKN
jgi:tRNA(adenine34) deaminase